MKFLPLIQRTIASAPSLAVRRLRLEQCFATEFNQSINKEIF